VRGDRQENVIEVWRFD